MRIKPFCFAAALALLAGCSGHRVTDEEREEKRRAQLEMQSVMDMVTTKQVPPISFKTGSAELEPSSFKVLDMVAQVLLNHPRLKLVVEGHTDDVGSDEWNLQLSKMRASSVKHYLAKKGVYPDFIRAYGFGESRRLTEDTSDRGRALNRRVEFRITTRDWESVY